MYLFEHAGNNASPDFKISLYVFVFAASIVMDVKS